MNLTPLDTQRFEFSFPRQDMHVRVEVDGEEVTVRASRNGFSEQRKSAFIREMAAEGFIPDAHRWYFGADGAGFGRGVKWVIDRSWMETDGNAVAPGRDMVLSLFSSSFVCTAVLMALLFSGNLGNFRVEAPQTALHTAPDAHVAALG